MPYSISNGVRIYFETIGAPGGEPAIFIEGFGGQSIGWHDEFCQKFAIRGINLIRFDNRDVGLSDKFGGPQNFDGHYTLFDMAKDVFGVLDTLKLESVHVVGQSMGGVIAQLMAIECPQRVHSLSLIYTFPDLEYLTDETKDRLLARGGAGCSSREEAIEAFIEQERMAGSTLYPFDEQSMRIMGGRAYDRCYCPAGVERQAAALHQFSPQRDQLAKLEMPAALLHGRADRLVKVEGTIELGRLLRNAEVHLYPGMGHELVRPLWDDFANIITRTITRGRSA